MPVVQKDSEREYRILMEIIADANGPEEQAMGWYYYLQDNISFPFRAICIVEMIKSPLRPGDKVKILEMVPEDDCGHEMFVETTWRGRKLAVPLAQVQPVESTDGKTKEAAADWHYWTARGYELS
jgi:hypothetical protein